MTSKEAQNLFLKKVKNVKSLLKDKTDLLMPAKCDHKNSLQPLVQWTIYQGTLNLYKNNLKLSYIKFDFYIL